MLDELLRQELGFQGVVVADYFSIDLLVRHHRVASDKGAAAAMALAAGGQITIRDWPSHSVQPDTDIRSLIQALGGEITESPMGLKVTGGQLRGDDRDMSAIGELVPTVAALATQAETPTRQ